MSEKTSRYQKAFLVYSRLKSFINLPGLYRLKKSHGIICTQCVCVCVCAIGYLMPPGSYSTPVYVQGKEKLNGEVIFYFGQQTFLNFANCYKLNKSKV